MSIDNEGRPGMLAGIWKFFTFRWVRQALAVHRAADKTFTGSAAGIRDAFDLQREKYVRQYTELRDGVAEVEGLVQEDKGRLDEHNKREAIVLQLRDGALQKFEAAKTDEEKKKHEEAFARFDAEVHDIEGRQAELEARIKDSSGKVDAFLRQLSKMQAEIQALPREKAAALADYVSASKIVEINDRLAGVQSNIDRGPIEAVLAQNRQLTARARVSEKLAGSDVQAQNDEYMSAGKAAEASGRMAEMLAARRARRESATGVIKAAGQVDLTEGS